VTIGRHFKLQPLQNLSTLKKKKEARINPEVNLHSRTCSKRMTSNRQEAKARMLLVQLPKTHLMIRKIKLNKKYHHSAPKKDLVVDRTNLITMMIILKIKAN